MASQEVRAFSILQAQKAVTPPYSRYAVDLGRQLSLLERLLAWVLSAEVVAGWALFRRRHRFDVVVTAHYRTSVIFGLLCNLFGRSALHVVKELYLDEAVLQSRLTRWVFRRALKGCDCIITNCSAEIPAYSTFLDLPADRFRFLAWPSNLPIDRAAPDDGYVFAAGRSFRDWATLFAAAREQPEATFVVVAEATAVNGLDRPDNVVLHCDVPRQQYLDLLHGARAVVVPLQPTVRSTGQATILEAMSLGKPILTARTPGVLDYVRAGRNGLFYDAGDSRMLAQQLERLLTDPDLRYRLSRHALRSIEQRFNKARYARRMLRLVRDLVANRPPETTAPAEVISARVTLDAPGGRSSQLIDRTAR